MLEIEPGARVVEGRCTHCDEPMTRVTAFVQEDGAAHAIYFASCYHHDGHEVWIDAIFSPTWAEGADDRVTFGCRVGPVEGQVDPAATLVSAAAAFSEAGAFGRKLSREDALSHNLLGRFWELIDHLLTHDPVVSLHIYGAGATFEQ